MCELNPIRFGLVGAGAIAQTYAQAFADCDQGELVAVADTRVDVANELAQASGCAAFSSALTMVEEVDIQAVVVCTPPSTHRDIAKIFVERGIAVLCEKPLSIDRSSAIEMLGLAREHNVILSMASKFRFVADVSAAKQLVDSGTVGEVLLFENVFTGHVDMQHRWNSNPHVSGGGVLIDNGTHSVDITRYFLGELAELQVMEGNRVQELPVEDTVKMFVRSKEGVLASVDLSWSMNKEQPYYIAIYGSEGTLLVGWKESKYRRTGDQEWTVFGNGYSKKDAFVGQLRNFAAAVRGEAATLVSPADALASVEVLEAAYDALQLQTWQTIVTNDSDALSHVE